MNMLSILSVLNQKFQGKKTYATAIVTILGALLAFFNGDITVLQGLELSVPALLGMFIRNGVTTEIQKAMLPKG